MSVVIGVKDYQKGVTHIGGDSLRVANHVALLLPKNRSKVYETGGFVIGHVGVGRIRNITQNVSVRFGKSGPSADFDLERTLIEYLIPAFRAEAEKLQFVSKDKDKIPNIKGSVLIAVGTQLCMVGTDLSVTPIDGQFHAIGSGGKVALGAMEAAVNEAGIPPKKALRIALKASEKYITTVQSPFTVLTTKPL